jgi:TctA family transporter
MLREAVAANNIYLYDDKESLQMCVGMTLNQVSVSFRDYVTVSFRFTDDEVNYITNVKFKDFAIAMQTIEGTAKHLNKRVVAAESSSEIVNKFVFEDNLFFAVPALQE